MITLSRTLPTIVASAREGFRSMGGGAEGSVARTDRDLPMMTVVVGSLLLAVFLAVMPGLPTQGNILAALLTILFGFFFATVSSRITGLIGSSSNPISGMTIATLIITCIIFVALGWTGDAYGPIALSVGAIVCIAAANAGNTSQDLKTGYLVGATPKYQQMGLAIGVVTSAFIIGMTVLYMSFAVGAYLPIATTAPIFAGGVVRWWVERKTGEKSDSDLSAGTLFSSGLIAGGSLAGILYAILVGADWLRPFQVVGEMIPALRGEEAFGQVAGGLLFLVLAVILARFAQRKV